MALGWRSESEQHLFMRAYFIRRFLLIIPTFLGITLVSFLIMHIVPGGPIEQAIQQIRMGGQSSESGGSGSEFLSSAITNDAIEQMRKDYGFDQPVLLRYLRWLWNVLRLDLGTSYVYGDPVWEVIRVRLPISLYFGSISFCLTYLVCIPLGVLKAIKHNTLFDTVTSILVFVGYATPGFALGIMLLVLLGGGSFWDVFPLGGFVSDDFADFTFWEKVADLLKHTLLPVFCYMISSFATLTLMMKNSLLEHLNQDYILTAFAKGLTSRAVVYRHALRNSLIPLATGFGGFLSIILAGSFLIEKVFNIDGMGLLGYTSVVERDYPVVLGILVISSLLGLVGNILSDVCYILIDPRIEFR